MGKITTNQKKIWKKNVKVKKKTWKRGKIVKKEKIVKNKKNHEKKGGKCQNPIRETSFWQLVFRKFLSNRIHFGKKYIWEMSIWGHVFEILTVNHQVPCERNCQGKLGADRLSYWVYIDVFMVYWLPSKISLVEFDDLTWSPRGCKNWNF